MILSPNQICGFYYALLQYQLQHNNRPNFYYHAPLALSIRHTDIKMTSAMMICLPLTLSKPTTQNISWARQKQNLNKQHTGSEFGCSVWITKHWPIRRFKLCIQYLPSFSTLSQAGIPSKSTFLLIDCLKDLTHDWRPGNVDWLLLARNHASYH